MPFRHHLPVDAFDIREFSADTLDPEGYGGVVGECCLMEKGENFVICEIEGDLDEKKFRVVFF